MGMMRVRGGFFCLFLVVMIVVGGSVCSVHPHKWFNTADTDLLSFTGLVSSSLVLCDDALNWSLNVNCSVDVNNSLHLMYDWGALNSSIASVEMVDALVFFDLSDIVDIEEDIASYGFLQDLIVPLEWFVDNITNFVDQHQVIILGFSSLINVSFSERNESSTQEILASIRTSISSSRRHLRDAMTVLHDVSWDLEDLLLERILILFDVLDKYDRFVELFRDLYPDDTPLITLFSEDDEVFLFDRIDLFGYCMAGSRFLANKSVWLYQNDEQIGQVTADNFGRFEGNLSVDVGFTPGNYLFYTSMRYDGIWYDSVVVEIEISRIPLIIDYEIAPRHVYINDSITVSGMVVDHKNRGVDIVGFFTVENVEIELTVDDGFFSIIVPVDLIFGRYVGRVLINGTLVYQDAVSDGIVFYVDIPTVLVLTTPRMNISVEEGVVLLGSLTEGINGEPLESKTVNIVLGNSVVGSTVTDDFGAFRYVFSSKGLGSGLYEFQASFVSDEVQWRGCISDPLMVHVGVSWSAFLSFMVIAFIMVLLFVVLWVFRDRLSRLFDQVVPQHFVGVSSEDDRPRLRFARRISRSFRRISLGAQMTQDAVSEAVFAQYRMLLRFLVAEGVIVGPTDTHLDLQYRMHQQGFPGSAVDIVTETFEQAMYSTQPVTYEQLLVFDQGVFQLMTQAEV
jgi:hypothetical protein